MKSSNSGWLRSLIGLAAVALLAVSLGAQAAPRDTGVFSALSVGDKVYLREPIVEDDGFLIANYGEFNHQVQGVAANHVVLRSLAQSADGSYLLRYIPSTHISQVVIRTTN